MQTRKRTYSDTIVINCDNKTTMNEIVKLRTKELLSLLVTFCNLLYTFIKQYIINTKIFVYVIWVCLHYISAHLYVRYCTPVGITGFIYSLFMGPTPVCYALSWAIYTGNQSLFHMWSLFGSICVAYLSYTKPQSNE